MDQMIARADFMHTENDDAAHDFPEALDDYTRQNENLTLREVQAAFKALQEKVCRQDFPSEGTSGYYMAYHSLQKLQSVASDLIDEGKARPEDFQEKYLQFILNMIAVGPLSSHVELIIELRDDSDVQFQDYFKSLRGKNLVNVIRSVRKEYHADRGMDWRRYSDFFDKFSRVWFCESFSEEQLKEAHKEFVDLYLYFETGSRKKSEEIRKYMHDFAYRIDIAFDRELFQGIGDADFLAKKVEELTKIILAPEFPEADDVFKSVRDVMKTLLKVVSKEGLITTMYEAIMELALNLTIKKAGCEPTRQIFEDIGYFFYHIEDHSVKNNGDLYNKLVKKFIYFLDNVKDEAYLVHKFVGPVMYNCLNEAMGTSEGEVRQWLEMIKALLKHSIPSCIEAAHRAMREKDKLLKWKKYPEDIKQIFHLLSQISFPKFLTEEQVKKGYESLKELCGHFLDEAKKAGITKLELQGSLLEFVFHCLEIRSPEAWDVADTVAERLEFNPKKDREMMMDAIRRMTAMFEDERYDWDDDDNRDLGNAVQEVVSKIFDSVKDGKIFTWEEYDDLIYFTKLSQTKMNEMSEPTRPPFFTIFCIISMNIANWLTTMNETHRLIPLIPGMLEAIDNEEESIHRTGSSFLAMVSRTAGNLFAPYLNRLIEHFLESEQDEILMAIWNSYEFNPAPLEKHFDQMFEYVDSGNSSIRNYLLQVLQKAAKIQPSLFTSDKVEVLMKEAREDQTSQVQLLMIIADIAKHHLDVVEPFIDDFLKPDLWQTHSAYFVISVLQFHALDSEEKAERVINHLLDRIKKSSDRTEVLCALNACRLIGFKHRPAIEKHRKTIEDFKDNTSDNDYHTSATNILDMLDGKSLDKIAEELREVQGDVAELDARVTATENDLSEVKDTVERHGDDLDNVKNDVSEQGQRLGQVESTVDETVAKVQEIDGKTLSHAPYWARDVSKLLNVEADNDWRLLSLRLGFSNDDIRAWSQTADPCMSMLNEWYTTHKTREATHAILTSLQLLDREDAAVIVENAMKLAEDVVEDTDFEYATPPDIFLSYQWGHQNEVRLLRQHLEMAGFSCWMDVGQMGGGDKLFEKIDAGIRGAKVVISCVTGKYAKSPNCNREVNLAVNLGKPIIPLLMEKTTWPPPGSMGPIFSEYLFIRFFQRGGEETTDQRYWPLPKFQELLMQLSLIGVKPDESVVQPEYKDWWLPKVEEVTIDKDRAKNQTSANSAPAPDDKKAAESPDIFISYQWGKQPQIIKLYKRLTSLGYTCWLDIMQMGGGDSLYDKIDRGLRGCKMVLSCITTKYAKSANCRREVSLADALQKPLVPLLLETLQWPPPGPMAPILTQLLYINCTRDNMEETWTGPKFDELLAVIDQHVPRPPGREAEREKEEDEGKKEEEKKEKEPAPPVKKEPTPLPAQKDERKQKVESSVPRENQRAAVSETPVAPAYKAAADESDDNTNNSQSQEKGEQKAGDRVHGRRVSNDDSMHSYLGHDAYNTNNQNEFIQSSHKLQAKSGCCVVM